MKDAFVLDKYGKKIIDFKKIFTLINYSKPVDLEISKKNFLKSLFIKKIPSAIPYITLIIIRWGFCITDIQKKIIKKYSRKDFLKLK